MTAPERRHRPPLVAGGQGRSGRSVRRDADALLLTLLVPVLLVLALVVKGCCA